MIAVVDEGGTLLLLQRFDDTQVASVNVGIDKARTAAIFRRPSKVFEEQVRNCLLYTSDAADERPSVDFGGRGIIKKKNSV